MVLYELGYRGVLYHLYHFLLIGNIIGYIAADPQSLSHSTFVHIVVPGIKLFTPEMCSTVGPAPHALFLQNFFLTELAPTDFNGVWIGHPNVSYVPPDLGKLNSGVFGTSLVLRNLPHWQLFLI